MKSVMNQGKVCLFEPKLCHNVVMASRNPLESLWTPKPCKNNKNLKKKHDFPPASSCHVVALISPCGLLRCGEHIRLAGRPAGRICGFFLNFFLVPKMA